MSLSEEERESLFRAFVEQSQARIKNPRTMEQKIEWVKNHPRMTADYANVFPSDVLKDPEKYAKMLVC